MASSSISAWLAEGRAIRDDASDRKLAAAVHAFLVQRGLVEGLELGEPRGVDDALHGRLGAPVVTPPVLAAPIPILPRGSTPAACALSLCQRAGRRSLGTA